MVFWIYVILFENLSSNKQKLTLDLKNLIFLISGPIEW